MKTCLITGPKGLVGSHLLKELSEYQVYAIGPGQMTGCQTIKADLTDPDFVRHLPSKIDVVIHLAQSRHFREFPEKSADIFAVNTTSTLQLLNYARQAGAQNFIYASSGAVYGAGANPQREEDPITLQSHLGFYYASKLAAEMLVQNYASFFNAVNLRFFFVYGPGQKSNMLVPRLYQSVLEGKAIQLQGEQGIRINPIYAKDAALAVKAAIQLEKSEIVNVGGNEVLSLKQIGQMIGEMVGREPIFDVNQQMQPQDLIGDITKMKNLLVIPQASFNEGIAAYANSFQACRC